MYSIASDEPQPDYSDDENDDTKTTSVDDDKEEDYVELRKTVKNRISAMLTREEWDQILDKNGLEQYEGIHLPLPRPHGGCLGAD